MIKKILAITLSIPLILLSCSKISPNKVDTDDTESNPVVTEPKYYSPYTGEEVSKEILNNKPFMVIVENSSSSRPQSGLNNADIIFETMAEGGIPRFIALFHKNYVEKIGPVRSARPYFISIAKDNALPFAHCGGSQEALNTISKNSDYMSINEIAQGAYFWRDQSRKAPHNLYTSSKNILKFISDKNLLYTPKSNFTFSNEYWDNSTFDSLDRITLKLNKFYSTSYIFKDGFYQKSMDGEESLDSNTNLPLKFTNIVLQKTDITLQKDNTHLDIRLDGTGDVYILSKGKFIQGTWKKDGTETLLLDSNNIEIPLSPGNTIWHVIPNDIVVPLE